MPRPKKSAPAPAPEPVKAPAKKPAKKPVEKKEEKKEPPKKASLGYMDEQGNIDWDKLKNLLKEI